ncbi:phosphodiesterase [Asanoa siamensis]|uniref:phosphodiesterase n=1 Tax=Asanoa siamensis TaxID=926357 RepID=UPI00194463FD|nr:phosphodiesterase [Asanoa siamensis]
MGRTFEATLTCTGTAGSGFALFDRPGTHPALVRLSRGAGLPRGWPDVLGVAVRVPDLDLLVSTSLGRAPLARQIPFLRRAVPTTYTSIASYRTRDGRRLLGVLPASAPARFLVATATRLGPWRVAGRIDLGEPLPAEADARLAFDPLMTSVPGVVADGLLWRWRATAYRQSRAGRRLGDREPVRG